MSQDYDELENQIGNAGGMPEETPQKGLGRIQYSEILGGKGSLSEEEQASMEAFKSRTKQAREEREKPVNVSDGWIPVNRDEMGVRSAFYPPEWEFFVKPAAVSAIKNWTAIDEERADQVNTVMNEIIRTSVKIVPNGAGQGGWGKINSWDRFWFILKVREATFMRGETKIEFEDACDQCDQDITYELNSHSLFYEFPDEELVEKYWTGSVWEIDPSEYDVDHAPITLYTPTLEKDNAIIEWATAKARAKQKVDETFIQYLMWMLNKPAKDAALVDKQIDKIYKEYKGWSVEMFDFMTDVIRNLTINPSENLRCTCPNCGQEATSTVKFPNGIKALFRIETKAKKFGSR